MVGHELGQLEFRLDLVRGGAIKTLLRRFKHMCFGTIPSGHIVNHRSEFRATLGAQGCDLDEDECRWCCEEAEFEGLGRVCPGVQLKRISRGCRLWGSTAGPKFDQPHMGPNIGVEGWDVDEIPLSLCRLWPRSP